MNTKKLKSRDMITVALLSLVNIVIFLAGTFLYLTPITVLLMPVVYALLQGIVFFIIGAKVQKRGAIFLYCVIQGVMGFYIPYILLYCAAGILAEIILAKTGYSHPLGMTVSYVVTQVLACMGSTVYPYAIALNATLEGMKNTGNLNVNIEQAGALLESWGTVALLLGVAGASIVSAWIGNRVVKKHILNDAKA